MVRMYHSVLGLMVCVCIGCGPAASRGPQPLIFSPLDDQTGTPLYSIVLPHNWERIDAEDGIPNVAIYKPAGKDLPYLYVSSRPASVSGKKSTLQAEEFLNSSEYRTSFYDERRNLVWSRKLSQAGSVVTSATFSGESTTLFRFFCTAVDDHDFRRTLSAIIDNVRLYDGDAPQQLPVTLADLGVPADLFAPAESSGFHYYLFGALATVIVVLSYVVRQMSRREHDAIAAQVDQAREERKRRRRQGIQRQEREAAVYVQKMARRNKS